MPSSRRKPALRHEAAADSGLSTDTPVSLCRLSGTSWHFSTCQLTTDGEFTGSFALHILFNTIYSTLQRLRTRRFSFRCLEIVGKACYSDHTRSEIDVHEHRSEMCAQHCTANGDSRGKMPLGIAASHNRKRYMYKILQTTPLNSHEPRAFNHCPLSNFSIFSIYPPTLSTTTNTRPHHHVSQPHRQHVFARDEL